MGIEETAGPQGPGADGPSGGGPAGRSGLGKKARVAILVVVIGGLLLLGLVASARRRADFDRQKTRVQVEAQAAGDTIDVEAFRAAWAEELTGDPAGEDQRPARALIPDVPGAELSNYTVVGAPNPTQVIIDYEFEAGGQNGCVRIHRSAAGTQVVVADDICPKSFSEGAPN